MEEPSALSGIIIIIVMLGIIFGMIKIWLWKEGFNDRASNSKLSKKERMAHRLLKQQEDESDYEEDEDY